MLQIYIGYDPVESVAFYTLAHSIQRRASVPVSIAPLARHQLKSLYTRERGPTESTEFSLTRFLVPALSVGFSGTAGAESWLFKASAGAVAGGSGAEVFSCGTTAAGASEVATFDSLNQSRAALTTR